MIIERSMVMKGRMEHRLRTENNINNILLNMPDYVTDYYYNMAVSHEPKTCEEYLRKTAAFLLYLSKDTKNIDIRKINDSDIAKYIHSLETKRDSKGNIKMTSFSYRKMVYSSLNSFFNYLAKSNIIETNYVERISRPRNEDHIERKHLTSRDFTDILSQVDTGAGSELSISRQKKWKSRDYAIFVVMMCTGIREAALTEINIEDIDFESKTITVIDKRFTTHVYHINNKMEKAICDWLADREELLDGESCDALFISNQKKRISEGAVWKIVKKYAKNALGYEISPHKIRSGFCTILYDQTGDIEFVRDAVGHKNMETTKRYIVKDGFTKEKSANIINDLI